MTSSSRMTFFLIFLETAQHFRRYIMIGSRPTIPRVACIYIQQKKIYPNLFDCFPTIISTQFAGI